MTVTTVDDFTFDCSSMCCCCCRRRRFPFLKWTIAGAVVVAAAVAIAAHIQRISARPVGAA